MIGRMPILGQDDVWKPRSQSVDDRNHFVAARNRKGATRAEIVLNIDHEQNVTLATCHVAHLVTQCCISLFLPVTRGSSPAMTFNRCHRNALYRDRSAVFTFSRSASGLAGSASAIGSTAVCRSIRRRTAAMSRWALMPSA